MAPRRLIASIRKEFALLLRDRRLLAPLFIIPVVQVVILSYGATLEIKRLGAGVCDMDMTGETRRLVSAMEATGYFKVKLVSDPKMLTDMLDRREITIGIVIPNGFSSGRNREIQVLVDGSNTSVGQIALYYFSGVLLRGFLGSFPIDDRVHVLPLQSPDEELVVHGSWGDSTRSPGVHHASDRDSRGKGKGAGNA